MHHCHLYYVYTATDWLWPNNNYTSQLCFSRKFYVVIWWRNTNKINHPQLLVKGRKMSNPGQFWSRVNFRTGP